MAKSKVNWDLVGAGVEAFRQREHEQQTFQAMSDAMTVLADGKRYLKELTEETALQKQLVAKAKAETAEQLEILKKEHEQEKQELARVHAEQQAQYMAEQAVLKRQVQEEKDALQDLRQRTSQAKRKAEDEASRAQQAAALACAEHEALLAERSEKFRAEHATLKTQIAALQEEMASKQRAFQKAEDAHTGTLRQLEQQISAAQQAIRDLRQRLSPGQ